MKIIVTGAKGFVGGAVLRRLVPAHDVEGTGREIMDITDRVRVAEFFRERRPDVVVHCAAFAAVDPCEEQAGDAYRVNGFGTQNVALACAAVGAKLIVLSTDFIFDGRKREPYFETDLPGPLSVYARSKLLAEHAACLAGRFLIIRTSRVFGPGGSNFACRLPELLRTKQHLKASVNLVNSPTYVEDLAEAMVFLMEKDAHGVIHVSNRGSCSWLEFAQAVKDIAGGGGATLEGQIYRHTPGITAERPAFSSFDTTLLSTLGFSMPAWRDSLRKFVVALNS